MVVACKNTMVAVCLLLALSQSVVIDQSSTSAVLPTNKCELEYFIDETSFYDFETDLVELKASLPKSLGSECQFIDTSFRKNCDQCHDLDAATENQHKTTYQPECKAQKDESSCNELQFCMFLSGECKLFMNEDETEYCGFTCYQLDATCDEPSEPNCRPIDKFTRLPLKNRLIIKRQEKYKDGSEYKYCRLSYYDPLECRHFSRLSCPTNLHCELTNTAPNYCVSKCEKYNDDQSTCESLKGCQYEGGSCTEAPATYYMPYGYHQTAHMYMITNCQKQSSEFQIDGAIDFERSLLKMILYAFGMQVMSRHPEAAEYLVFENPATDLTHYPSIQLQQEFDLSSMTMERLTINRIDQCKSIQETKGLWEHECNANPYCSVSGSDCVRKNKFSAFTDKGNQLAGNICHLTYNTAIFNLTAGNGILAKAKEDNLKISLRQFLNNQFREITFAQAQGEAVIQATVRIVPDSTTIEGAKKFVNEIKGVAKTNEFRVDVVPKTVSLFWYSDDSCETFVDSATINIDTCTTIVSICESVDDESSCATLQGCQFKDGSCTTIDDLSLNVKISCALEKCEASWYTDNTCTTNIESMTKAGDTIDTCTSPNTVINNNFMIRYMSANNQFKPKRVTVSSSDILFRPKKRTSVVTTTSVGTADRLSDGDDLALQLLHKDNAINVQEPRFPSNNISCYERPDKPALRTQTNERILISPNQFLCSKFRVVQRSGKTDHSGNQNLFKNCAKDTKHITLQGYQITPDVLVYAHDSELHDEVEDLNHYDKLSHRTGRNSITYEIDFDDILVSEFVQIGQFLFGGTTYQSLFTETQIDNDYMFGKWGVVLKYREEDAKGPIFYVEYWETVPDSTEDTFTSFKGPVYLNSSLPVYNGKKRMKVNMVDEGTPSASKIDIYINHKLVFDNLPVNDRIPRGVLFVNNEPKGNPFIMQYSNFAFGHSTGCPPGEEGDGTTCTKCSAGKYSKKNGLTTICEACPTGQYQPYEGKKECEPCGSTGEPNEASTACESCGVTGLNAENGVCIECPIGQYDQGSECIACPAGKYTDDSGKFRLTDCSVQIGTCSKGEKLVIITKTPLQTKCEPCEANTFMNFETHSKEKCYECKDMLGTNGEIGQSSCDFCREEYYDYFPIGLRLTRPPKNETCVKLLGDGTMVTGKKIRIDRFRSGQKLKLAEIRVYDKYDALVEHEKIESSPTKTQLTPIFDNDPSTILESQDSVSDPYFVFWLKDSTEISRIEVVNAPTTDSYDEYNIIGARIQILDGDDTSVWKDFFDDYKTAYDFVFSEAVVEDKSDTLSTGAIAGIAGGGTVFIAGVGYVAYSNGLFTISKTGSQFETLM